jgi:hypothetical protein
VSQNVVCTNIYETLSFIYGIFDALLFKTTSEDLMSYNLMCLPILSLPLLSIFYYW